MQQGNKQAKCRNCGKVYSVPKNAMHDWGHMLRLPSARNHTPDTSAENKELKKKVAMLERQLAKADAGENLAGAQTSDDRAQLKQLEDARKVMQAANLPVHDVDEKITQLKAKLDNKDGSLKAILGKLAAVENLAKQQGTKLDKLLQQAAEAKKQFAKTATEVASLRAKKAQLLEQEREKETATGHSDKAFPNIPDHLIGDAELRSKHDRIVENCINNLQRLHSVASAKVAMASKPAVHVESTSNGRPHSPPSERADPPSKAPRSDEAQDVKAVMGEYRQLDAQYERDLLLEDPAFSRMSEDGFSDGDRQNGLDLPCGMDEDEDEYGDCDPQLRAMLREGDRRLAEARAAFKPGLVA